MFIKCCSGTGSTYLVICDGICQLLDKSSQDFGIVNIAKESNKRMLRGERFKLRDDPLKLPERG